MVSSLGPILLLVPTAFTIAMESFAGKAKKGIARNPRLATLGEMGGAERRGNAVFDVRRTSAVGGVEVHVPGGHVDESTSESCHSSYCTAIVRGRFAGGVGHPR